MKTTFCLGFLILASLFLLSGCATMSSARAPGVDLGKIKTIYVIKHAADGRGVNKVIADQIASMGYHVTTGPETAVPEAVDAALTYEDRWTWDITMYLLRLSIQLRDPKTGFLLAEGESYRPSLQRQSPAEMAKEILESIFTASN